MSTDVRTFGGWRRERVGVVLGLSLGRLLVLVLLGMPAIAAFYKQDYAGAGIWLAGWAVLVALVAIPIRGRAAATWMVHWIVWRLGRASGIAAWQSKASGGAIMTKKDADTLDLPGPLQLVELVDGPPLPSMGLTQPALIRDKHAGGSWRMVARLSHPGISMATSDRRDSQAAALGDLMAALATSGIIRRVSLYVRAEPGDGVERAAWRTAHRVTGLPRRLQTSLEGLEAQVKATSISYDIFLTIEASETRLRREARAAGGGAEGRARVLYRNLSEVTSGLMGAGVEQVSWLTSAELVEAIRSGYEPSLRGEVATAKLAARGGADVKTDLATATAGPARAINDRAAYQHGAWTSRSFAIVLPSMGTQVGSLAPLLMPAGPRERRSLAMHYEPIAPAKAQRRVEREVTDASVATETRSRMGLRLRVRDRRQEAQISRQEQVISAGHTLVRMAGVASVTVPADVDIDDHAAGLTAAARSKRFELLPMDLAQDAGFVASCLPVGIGLPTRGGWLA